MSRIMVVSFLFMKGLGWVESLGCAGSGALWSRAKSPLLDVPPNSVVRLVAHSPHQDPSHLSNAVPDQTCYASVKLEGFLVGCALSGSAHRTVSLQRQMFVDQVVQKVVEVAVTTEWWTFQLCKRHHDRPVKSEC